MKRACALCGRRVDTNILANGHDGYPVMVFHVDHAGYECRGSSISADAAYQLAVARGKKELAARNGR